jgi:hypothetical protein
VTSYSTRASCLTLVAPSLYREQEELLARTDPAERWPLVQRLSALSGGRRLVPREFIIELTGPEK